MLLLEISVAASEEPTIINNHHISQSIIIKHDGVTFSANFSFLKILNNLSEHFWNISAKIVYCFRAYTSQAYSLKLKNIYIYIYINDYYYCYSNHVFNSL